VRELRAPRGVPVTIARPFNNYGPGLRIDDRRVLPDFARDVLAGRDIVMLSDGSATRTFCYVMDAVDGYYRILASVGPASPTTSAPTGRRSRCGSSPSAWPRSATG
jgi:nucleoside-diphosphate-sugar epimerase